MTVLKMQDQYLQDGTHVLTWQLHWVCGWAPEHGEYRAVMADNYGHTDVYRGHIDGDCLIFESLAAAGPRLRFTLGCLRPERHHLAQRDVTGGWIMVPHRGIRNDPCIVGQ